MAEALTQEELLAKAKSEVKFLTNKRGQIKASLTRLSTYLSSLPTPLTSDTLVQIETRLNIAESTLKEFEQIQTGIEDICLVHNLSDANDQDKVRSDFEEKYFATISKAKHMLQPIKPIQVDNLHQNPEQVNPINRISSIFATKLPPLSIPEFSGSYEAWTQFFETFEALIDKNMSLTNVQKFYYLQSALKGDAAQIISALTATNSKLNTLNPFLDNNGVLRVGGRLNRAKVDYNYKHPMLIPYKHPLSDLIVTHEHIRNLHPGAQATLSFVRQRFWPLHGKQLVKSIVRKCIICFKTHPRTLQTQMGDLPSPRVTPSYSFHDTGVDYAGPFLLRDSKFRNKRVLKCYICLFVCLATKAVHLELATELSTQSFIAAFTRFTARRGLCKNLFPDNGSNFIGANNEFKAINEVLRNGGFQDFIKNNMIQWNFIPSHSPHSGLWEASVKSAKQHLKRVTNNSPLYYEEFYTLLVQVEAILNSRPLVALSDDPNDLEALTPGHFLIGRPLNKHPELDVADVADNRLARYQHIQKMSQHFWTRWSAELLHTLHQRFKWKSRVKSSELLGSLVLLKEDNLPSMHWKKGRIVALHPGRDGAVRVVSVQTSNGVIKRAVTKVCPLPINCSG